MRTIRNFLLTQMPETAEAGEDDYDGTCHNKSVDKVCNTWATLESITASLQLDPHTYGKHRHQAPMEKAKDLTMDLWGFDDNDTEQQPAKHGHIAAYTQKTTRTTLYQP